MERDQVDGEEEREREGMIERKSGQEEDIQRGKGE
jgi:hypothetical protein